MQTVQGRKSAGMWTLARIIRDAWTRWRRGYTVRSFWGPVNGNKVKQKVFSLSPEKFPQLTPHPEPEHFHAGPVHSEDGDWAWKLIESPDLGEEWGYYPDYIPGDVYLN